MNKQLIIAAIVLLLVGGGLYMYQAKSPSGSSMMDRVKDGGSDLGTISGNLKDLAARGVPMQCSFTYPVDAGASSGTVYISGKNMRGDFMMKDAGGKDVESHMMKVDNTTYTWSSDQPKGMMMTISEEDLKAMESDIETLKSENPEQFDMEDQTMDYDCKPWVPNPALFTPPSDVEFTDYSAQMQKIQEMQKNIQNGAKGTLEDQQCAVCMQAPEGDARDQCKKAMGCS